MSADLEFSGRNIAKAVQMAAEKLRVPVEDVKYDILSHGCTGIFGLAGVKKARILVKTPRAGQQAAGRFADATEDHSADNRSVLAEGSPQAIAQARAVGESLLKRMVDAISPEASISVEQGEKELRFVIRGGQAGVLIGKRGQTLEAMQLIVEKAVRQVSGLGLRLQVDVEGYLEKRREGLISTAERLAQMVTTKGHPGSMGYLNAQDRRIVHLALKENEGVRTQSVGEGYVRKLMVYPRKSGKSRK